MKNAIRCLFGDGFRIFFLGAGVFGFFSILIWITYQLAVMRGVEIGFPLAVPRPLWHGHEMVFGYGAAALGGFFLTAVPNWTGAKAAPQRFVVLVAALWGAGRVAVWLSGFLPPLMVATIDLSFAPLLGLKIATQLIRKPKLQNMVFLLFLSYFWASNLIVHLDWIDAVPGAAETGLRGGLMALAGMILVLGGRITPGFTRNAMHRAGIETGTPQDPAAFTPIVIVVAVLLPLVALLAGQSTSGAAVYLLAGTVAMIRVALWHRRFQWSQPILWSLHVSYFSVGLGLMLLGLAGVTGLSEIAGLHFLAIGGIAGMTLAVMARASLGHSGRPLHAPRSVVAGFVALPLAGLIRWGGAQVMGDVYGLSILLSGGLWLLAFGGFLVTYAPIFVSPRVPRAPVSPVSSS